MIDNHRKGYLTEEDLQLVFGPEFHGKTMRALIAEAKDPCESGGVSRPSGAMATMDGDGTISAITYKELQQHLNASCQMPWWL